MQRGQAPQRVLLAFFVLLVSCVSAPAPRAPERDASAVAPPLVPAVVHEIEVRRVVRFPSRLLSVGLRFVEPDGTIRMYAKPIAHVDESGRIEDAEHRFRGRIDDRGHVTFADGASTLDLGDDGTLRVALAHDREVELDMTAYLARFRRELWRIVMLAFVIDRAFFAMGAYAIDATTLENGDR